MKITPNFTLEEFLNSDTAKAHGINNTTSDPVMLANIKKTAELLEKVRVVVGNRAIGVSSGWRSTALNKVLPGAAINSEHMQGLAADINVKGLTPYQVCKLIEASDIEYGQLIQENDAWVHISVKGQFNKQKLTCYNSAYSFGITTRKA